MKMRSSFLHAWGAAAWIPFVAWIPLVTAVTAQSLPDTPAVYNLIEGSVLVDDCPVCDRIPIVEPIRGTFELRLQQTDPLFATYGLENISFTNTGTLGRTYGVTGSGTLRVGGEVAVTFDLYLEVEINNGITNQPCYFATNWIGLSRPLPMLQAMAVQTNGTDLQQFQLDLNAAPFRELWFSTASNFTSGIGKRTVSNGDLLSNTGRTVKANTQLTAPFLIMPLVPDLGLKGFDILPGGEIAFSIAQDVWSEGLGRTLHHGDLLSARGLVLRTNQSLIAAFAPQTSDDVGLAAVQAISAGETWFSVQTNFFSKTLNTAITPGDVLSDSGTVIRRNAELISRFKPVDPSANTGLRALYVWPSGEIWFCVGTGFISSDGVEYRAGDLLSDQGYVVFRNTELLSSFAPDVTTNIPIDGLWLVTDVIPQSAPPRVSAPMPDQPAPGSVTVLWQGPGHVFQLESATNAGGPYVPVTPIIPDTSAIDAGALTNFPSSFYRVRQW